ncbi:glycerol-3-phosphate 1-O-acyltransferase PlsY [Afifella sp. IM 167]|uniref:glycerol-3-phosphate 1-O-acyltransferase PlsY n=1 Tax=Afifella sp. IM 167 TaxID=2033586 RepID=UPI001CCFB39E|nr:glycerol-3-phosphate 1-O-acyltransferase PlsY [Afifella sp. IM 167]MBZ8132617.1 glycerol-3-phosphate acyltransferase [Afifella sp. IM 167]
MVLSWTALAGLLFGYLLGTFPTGLILSRLAGFGDIRSIGSGNIGATNVLRTGSKKLAALTLLGDALKATIAIVLARRFGSDAAALAAAFGAFLGHCFPVWLGFKGGKGVATYFGVLLGLSWPTMLVAAAIWIGTAFATRYSSLAALLMSALVPVIFFVTGHLALAELFLILTALLWLRHRANLARLLKGAESKIGQK